MQTFLPYPSFEDTARCLDNRRLGKQIVEAYQVLKAITDPTYGWQNHPAVNQWRGYSHYLINYLTELNFEYWHRHRKEHKAYAHAIAYYRLFYLDKDGYPIDNTFLPPWLGYAPYHDSHKSALLAKDYSWYKQFGWQALHRPEINYIWPSKMKEFQI